MTDSNDIDFENRNRRPLSPCVLVCTLDDGSSCLGCGRTVDEIRGWAMMSREEQWELVDELAAREGLNDATIATSTGD